MTAYHTIGVIILAAGSSSRLGSPKQLVQFRNKSLLQNTIDATSGFSFDSKMLVLGCNGTEIAEATSTHGFTVVFNENWEEGLSSSIRSGIKRTLLSFPDIEHLMFLLSDQPFVNFELIKELVNVHRQSDRGITASVYEGILGVPAIFSKEFFTDLMQLKGDQGARKLLVKYEDIVKKVPFEMGHLDVDTASDVAHLRKVEKKAQTRE